MKRKQIGNFLIFFGIALTAYINLLDWLRGKTYSLGTLQVLASAIGLMIVLAGIYVKIEQFPLPHLKSVPWRKPVEKAEHFFGVLSQKIESIIKPTAFDIVVISGFALFALIYTLGRWNGITPFIYLGSDASYISSYAAALDHPGQFVADYFLSNQGHISSYLALHIPLIRFLNTLVGSYGNGFLVLLPITIFLKLFGFYFLGKLLFKNKGLALLLVIATYPIIYTGAWDYWGLLGDALPRNLFEIFLPWIILWSINWIDHPKRWYLLSFIVGLLVYVHSISAGIVFFAISFVYLIQSPTPFKKRIGQLIVNVLIFLVTITPFALIFYSSTESAQTIPITYQDSLSFLTNQYGSNRLDTLNIFINLIRQLWNSGILPLALLALTLLLVSRKTRNKGAYDIIGVWVLGILTISVIVPYLEKFVDPWLNMFFLQMMLIRGLRFIPPLLFILIFLLFFDRTEKLAPRYLNIRNFFFIGLIASAIILSTSYNQQDVYFNKGISCLVTGHLVCPTEEEVDAVSIIQALDTYTNIENTVLTVPPLSVSFTTSIRYQALRPMGYTRADVTRMSDNPALQAVIASAMKPWNALEHADADTRLEKYLSLAVDIHADYIIVQLQDFTEESVKLLTPVYSNENYALVKVEK